MNELERQIRELSLRQPGDSMDDRLFLLLQSSGDIGSRQKPHLEHAPAGKMGSCASKTVVADETTPTRRGIFSATFAGLATALLIGIAVGNAMPSLWSDSRILTTGPTSVGQILSASADTSIVPVNQTGSDIPTHHPMLPEVPAHVRAALKNRPTAGSQFVELSYQSAITGAALWQQQNGEIFNVATHLSDSRFDMCRDCHRVGG